MIRRLLRRWGPIIAYCILALGFVVTAENRPAALGCIVLGVIVGLVTRPKK